MGKWNIRVALPEDANGLQECMEKAYSTYQVRMGGERLPPMDINYSKEIAEFPTWVVELDDQITGGIIMSFEGDYASIANIAVHPQFQGKGIGGGLLTFAENKAKEKNYLRLRLATHILLTENISLYKHLGWTETDRDDTRVYMEKGI